MHALLLGLILAIDPSHSKAQFSVNHVWVEKVTGSVSIVSGEIQLSNGSAIPVSANAVIDASKVHTDDPDRDAALRSPDFFDVAKYPTWTFASTKIVANGTNAFEMDGNLTIHGVTQPEVLKVTIAGDAAHPVYHATLQIDRHAFGMAKSRLDPVIGNTVDVTLDIVTK